MTTLIFLAGGFGSRMGAPTPKQFLPLAQKPIALHSFDLLKNEVDEIVVVCAPQYQYFFPSATHFAHPGPRRQDSVYSGLSKATKDYVLIHDSARPFIEIKYLAPLLTAAHRTGAATLATPVTSTIKEAHDSLITKTLDRAHLWEIQTPQAIRRSLLHQAFATLSIDVTDDISLIEALGHPAEIVPSSPRNFKITTPFDLLVAEALCATN